MAYRFLVVFFLFVFELATSQPIRPTTLNFGKLVQCDLKRTETIKCGRHGEGRRRRRFKKAEEKSDFGALSAVNGLRS